MILIVSDDSASFVMAARKRATPSQFDIENTETKTVICLRTSPLWRPLTKLYIYDIRLSVGGSRKRKEIANSKDIISNVI